MGRGGALLARSLTMRCSVEPRQSGAVDADNRPVMAYGTATTGIPCRVMEKAEQLFVTPAQAGTVSYDKRMLVPATAAIRPLDQVTAIARPDPDSPASYVVFDPGPYIVRAVLDRADAVVQFRTALLARAGGA